MKLFVVVGLASLLLFAAGAGTGIAVTRYTDPLRQDSSSMEDWFQANIKGDTERMWHDSSKDFQTHAGDYAAFVQVYGHPPSTDPPRIVFEASVPLANGEEMFYTLYFPNRGNATISAYVDSQGRFDGFTQ